MSDKYTLPKMTPKQENALIKEYLEELEIEYETESKKFQSLTVDEQFAMLELIKTKYWQIDISPQLKNFSNSIKKLRSIDKKLFKIIGDLPYKEAVKYLEKWEKERKNKLVIAPLINLKSNSYSEIKKSQLTEDNGNLIFSLPETWFKLDKEQQPDLFNYMNFEKGLNESERFKTALELNKQYKYSKLQEKLFYYFFSIADKEKGTFTINSTQILKTFGSPTNGGYLQNLYDAINGMLTKKSEKRFTQNGKNYTIEKETILLFVIEKSKITEIETAKELNYCKIQFNMDWFIEQKNNYCLINERAFEQSLDDFSLYVEFIKRAKYDRSIEPSLSFMNLICSQDLVESVEQKAKRELEKLTKSLMNLKDAGLFKDFSVKKNKIEQPLNWYENEKIKDKNDIHTKMLNTKVLEDYVVYVTLPEEDGEHILKHNIEQAKEKKRLEKYKKR